jgi:hypothetical protein
MTHILTNNNKGNRWVLVVNYDLKMGSRFKRFMGRVKLQQQQKHTNQQHKMHEKKEIEQN